MDYPSIVNKPRFSFQPPKIHNRTFEQAEEQVTRPKVKWECKLVQNLITTDLLKVDCNGPSIRPFLVLCLPTDVLFEGSSTTSKHCPQTYRKFALFQDLVGIIKTRRARAQAVSQYFKPPGIDRREAAEGGGSFRAVCR